jgi:hypothetical protein
MKTIDIEVEDCKLTDIEVEDYELTESQISELANSKAVELCPNANYFDWEWVTAPKPIGSQRIPPDEFWVKTTKGLAATNGDILVLKNFLFPENFVPNEPWRILDESSKLSINKVLSKDLGGMLSHPGWFRAVFLPLAKIPGLKVLGDTFTSPGYMVVNGELVGVVTPVKGQRFGDFQFTL